MSNNGGRLPFPGLRSFTREETDLFFGREGCVDDMVDRLAATRFLAVLGASGSGKSSLVKTGLLDALELGLLHRAGSRWLIADFRPGDRPIHNMAEGLIRATSPDPNRAPDEEEVKFLRAFLARGPRSVVEWAEADNLPEGTNLLVLVDQFEELFRYSDYGEREEAEAFVALLLECAKAPLETARIYVAITMRSEYLGAAALIDGLAEAINRGMYLTPRMDRDQVRDAIAGPAAVCGFAIEPALVNRLLNDLTSFAPWEAADSGNQLERLVRRADQLPLMQHVLNRLWSIAAARGGSGPIELKLDDYIAVGGLRGALAAHGREILDELLPEHQEVASAVFRALTAGASIAEAVRRPTEFGELVEIAGGDEIAVREVVEAFRAPGRNFLFPPRPSALRSATVIDISHESLIRQWDQFAAWLQQEIGSAAAWKRLVDQAERHQRGEANLLSGLALASLANWWDTEHPTAAWAKRYGGDFSQAAAFLTESRKAEDARKEAEVEERRRKTHRRYIAFAATIAAIAPFTVFAGYSAWRENQAAIRANEAADHANEQALVADIARKAAEQERLAALDARRVAEEERQAAEEARETAESERQAADQARQEAVEAAATAEAERRAADEARQTAEAERRAALQARLEAVRAATMADTERQRADVERRRADQERARADQQRDNALLELAAGRIWSLQQDGQWDVAANLLGDLWTGLINTEGEYRENWLIDPVRDAFARQSLAEYPIIADFLTYAGTEGWSGSAGRFRVFSRQTVAGETTTDRSISVFDAVTGSVTGSFDLPPGTDLGSELDLVAPDGLRAAIVTDDARIALWAADLPAPVLIPAPAEEGIEIDVAQMAPVSTDGRFAFSLEVDGIPHGLIVVDPAQQATTFNISAADLAENIGSSPSLDALKLLGLVDNRLILLVDDPDGRIITLDVESGAVSELDVGGIVNSAELTPDGRVLLALTCALCETQDLVALDLTTSEWIWVEKAPADLEFLERAARLETIEGKTVYSAVAEDEGQAILFRFGTETAPPVMLDARSEVRVGEVTYDGSGGFRTVEAASDDTSGGVEATGLLVDYRIPLTRQKLRLYVAPNSVAIRQDEEGMQIAGVTYDGELLVYRRAQDGTFEEDSTFRPIAIGESDCIAAVGFGGDGRSLLFLHYDGSLQYVAAVGEGAGVGWRTPDGEAEGDAPIALGEGSPATDCELPDRSSETFVTERIVPTDAEGLTFAVLDKGGVARWVSVEDNAGNAEGGEEPTAATREIAPLELAGRAVKWLAGDPERNRIAMVTATAVDIVTRPGALARVAEAAPNAPAPDAPPAANARDEYAPAPAATQPSEQATGPQKLAGRGEPRAAAFGHDGTIAVIYADGQVAKFEEQNGTWSAGFNTTMTKAGVVDMFASSDRIAVAHTGDRMIVVDLATGALTSYAKLPASPSVVALGDDGMLSVEWDTDAVSFVNFASLPGRQDIAKTARLVTLRSRSDPTADNSIDALTRNMAAAASDEEDASADCADEARRRLARLEARLVGEAVPGEISISAAGCDNPDTGDDSLARAAESLAQRAQGASIRQLIEEESFTRVLRAAASGDALATRILGAVLARIASERGELDKMAIAEDALRFGTSFPSSVMRSIAAGGTIKPSLVEVAVARAGADAAAHQLVAHASERRINDPEALAEALFRFSVAERLYRENNRTADAEFAGHRRAHLARVLPDDRVLDVSARLDAWRPDPETVAPAADVADAPSDAAARNALDTENAGRLAERLPQSPLLEALRNELERTRLLHMAADVAGNDPDEVAELLIQFERKSGDPLAWSPDLVREYLSVAARFHDGGHSEGGLRLAAESLRMIGRAFQSPIQTDPEAVELFSEATALFVATSAAVPRELVKAEADGLDLPFLDYDYGNLPAVGAAAEVSAATLVLTSAASLAEAAGKAADDPALWDEVRGEALFWQGVLANDDDSVKAAELLKKSAALLGPRVEAESASPAKRFRYAEVLRWIGLAEPSTPETEKTEREALRQYAMVWEERDDFDADFLAEVGVGYGFATANLAQTIREINLQDLEDGRAAADHAAWVLEVLALAAEIDAINATMIERGAADGDSGFAAGWYRMSTHGWPLGFLGGLVNVESGSETVTDCDLMAADPYDPRRRAPGRLLEDVDMAAAESACQAESDANPEDLRAKYQLARVISWDSARASEYLPLAKEAAEQGVAPAFALVAYALDEADDDSSGDAYSAAAQRTIIESFRTLFPFLEARATSERDRSALRWYAEKAAALAVPEAHFALAQRSSDPVTKYVHLRLASRLWDEAGNRAAVTAAQRQLFATTLSAAQAEEADARIAEWKPEELIAVPEEASAS